jgi:putative polyketide hydroxylase
VSKRDSLPLKSVLVGASGDVVAPNGLFEQAYGLAADGAIIVRPDGVVAWRSPATSQGAESAVEAAMATLLAR